MALKHVSTCTHIAHAKVWLTEFTTESDLIVLANTLIIVIILFQNKQKH